MLFNSSFPGQAIITFSIGMPTPDSVRKAWIAQLIIFEALAGEKLGQEDKQVAIKLLETEDLKEALVLFLDIIFILSCTRHFSHCFNFFILTWH